ncbi:MAG: hypothetical protein ATN36_04850 [Epulopiscium sp. Nele67-Bin005]|nr:MAG: hypothetical protein ATN36_04850 [Epulopiscium sp. Nele67-Bin005]
MELQIKEKLAQIEEQKNVKIIYAIESGSRAWGFASPNSDYDVRFIYVRDTEFYLKLNKQRSVIEWQLDDIFDINGWDVKKACELLYKSNPTILEWCNSPIIYKETPEFQRFRQVALEYFRPKVVAYHYLSIAKKDYCSNLQNENIKLKSYFYILRALLSCRWTLEIQSAPPIEFRILAEKYLDGEKLNIVKNLIEVKACANEANHVEKISLLDNYICMEIHQMENKLLSFEKSQKNSWDDINKLFLSYTSFENKEECLC